MLVVFIVYSWLTRLCFDLPIHPCLSSRVDVYSIMYPHALYNIEHDTDPKTPPNALCPKTKKKKKKVNIKDKHARCFEHMNQNDYANDE